MQRPRQLGREPVRADKAAGDDGGHEEHDRQHSGEQGGNGQWSRPVDPQNRDDEEDEHCLQFR